VRQSLPTRFRFWIGGIITILFLVLLLFGVVRSGKWANLASNNSPEFKSDQIANEIKKDEEKRKRLGRARQPARLSIIFPIRRPPLEIRPPSFWLKRPAAGDRETQRHLSDARGE
jgi:hypothetical protein